MREDPELCSCGMDDAAANLNERVGLGWCAGVLVMVVYLRNGFYSKDMARDWSGRDSESEPASAMGIFSNQPRRGAHLHVQRCGGLCIIGTLFLPRAGV